MSGTIASSQLELVDALQRRYVRSLDRKDLQGWLATFSTRGQYVVISAENADAGLPLALMMDDCHERLVDRVTYVTKVWTFDEYQMRHLVQRLSAEPGEDGCLAVESNFSVFVTDSRGQSSILAVGRYEDLVEIGDGEARFRRKRVVFDNALLPMNLVYPI